MAEKKMKTVREPWKEYLDKVDTPKLKRAREIGKIVFYTVLIELVLVILVGGIIFLNYCRKSYIMYEDSQLEYAVDDLLVRLNEADADGLAALLDAELPEGTEFDAPEKVLADHYRSLTDKTFTAKEKRGYDVSQHVFTLYADEVPVGTFTFKSGKEETRLGLLTMTEWLYEGGEVSFTYDRYDRSYILPSGFTVVMNGKELSDSYIQSEKPIDEFEFVYDYADVPYLRTYVVEGLLEEPEVLIYDNLGNKVEFDMDAPAPELPNRYFFTDVPDELEDFGIEMAKLWANFTLRDATLDEIEAVLIPGSMIHKQVLDSNYDRRWIDQHELMGYENEACSEYISYTENCFSCRVTMDRTVLVYGPGSEVSNHLDNIFYFVRLDLTDDGTDNPQWYIADMQTA